MRRLVQDVLLAHGGAERVFWTLQKSGRFDSTIIGLRGPGAVRSRTPWRVLSEMGPGEDDDPRDALSRLVAAAHREPRLRGPTLVMHHHAGLQLDLAPGAATIYLHTPTRFLWEPDRAVWEHGVFGAAELQELRSREMASIEQAKAVLTNSEYTARRIARAYGCHAQVINPPTELWKAKPRATDGLDLPSRPYAITVSRLVFTKGLQQLIDATRSLGLILVIVGSGRASLSLRRSAGSHVRFVQGCSDSELRWLLRGSVAFVSFSREDFGLAAAEALCEGIPCVVPTESGIAECIDGGCGATFHHGDEKQFHSALEEVLASDKPPDAIVANYRQHFSGGRFVNSMIRLMG